MFCQNCGTQNADGVKFCSNCGNPMPTPKPVEETVVASEPTPVAPVYNPPVVEQPVAPAPAPVYAPVEPVAPAPAPAPAPEKPKKKNNNIIIIAIVAVIAVAAIVVGILFGTGVIGGDNKKKEEETTAKKTETTEEEKEETGDIEYNFTKIKYGEEEYLVTDDDEGNPIRGKDGSVFVCEETEDGFAKFDENYQPIGEWRVFEDGFSIGEYVYYPHVVVKIPSGWIRNGFATVNEDNSCVITVMETTDGNTNLDEAHAWYVEAYTSALATSTTLNEGSILIDGYTAKTITISSKTENGVSVVSNIYSIEVNGVFCFIVVADMNGTLVADNYVQNNVRFE